MPSPQQVSHTESRSDYRGVGIGLRAQHYQTLLNDLPAVPWLEALTDNYMNEGGLPLYYLEQVRSHYPLTFHGVGMSLGSTDPLDKTYLNKLKNLIGRFEPIHVSDHLCWSSFHGLHGNDLFPMPYTEEAISHISERILQVQEFLGQRILIENVSSYLSFKQSAMTEAEFLAEVVKRADCDLLCDVNNIYVSAQNHQFDAMDYLNRLPGDRIKEIHLAGFEDVGTHLLDTHGARVHDPVWDLYEETITRFGNIPTLIEWDTDIPEFSVLMEEREKAQKIMDASVSDPEQSNTPQSPNLETA